MATAANVRLDTGYFFQQIASADKRFLILDFDTTVAKLSDAPATRFPYPNARDLLECIAASSRTRLILASTAEPDALASALACPDFEVWACDGQQRLVPTTPGRTQRVPLTVRSKAGNDCRHSLIRQRSWRYPVAYLVGATAGYGADMQELFIVPELHLGKNQVLTATPEPLVQFLAEWLRACAGEIC